MSQIQSFISANPTPGTLLTLTGDSGGAVAPDGAGNIDIFSTSASVGFAEIIGSPIIPSTLFIGPLTGAAATNDNVFTFINVALPITFPTVIASSAYVLSANVIGSRDDFSASCGGFCTGVARREAVGNALLVGENTLASKDSPVGTPTFKVDLDGNVLGVFVQGLAGQTWNWTCTFTYQRQ